MSKVMNGLKHPKKAIAYLLLGNRKFWHYVNSSSCLQAVDPLGPLSKHLVKPSDIHEHLTTLQMLTSEFRCKTVLELGTAKGESTLALLLGVSGNDGLVFSIDLDDCSAAKELIEASGLTPYWKFIHSDDLSVEWDAQIDMLFVDTSHLFQHTLDELGKFEPWVKEGGLIVLHDTISFPQVKQAVVAYIGKHSNFHIYEYVNNNGLLILFKEYDEKN